jgi:hypothetical protein
LEKAGCDHIKTIAQAEAAFSVDDMKDPSAEATLMGGKDTSDARAEAKRAEEATERERRIGIIFGFLASVLALWLRTNQFFLL